LVKEAPVQTFAVQEVVTDAAEKPEIAVDATTAGN
jgi:hypothetical protein